MSNILQMLYQADDSAQVTLPSGIQATVKEMSGYEQKLLTHRGQAVNGQAINQVLARCVLSLNDTVIADLSKTDAEQVMRGLLSADRQALMFHIRKASLGDNFKFSTKCPHCEKKGEFEITLSEEEFPCKSYIFDEEDGEQNKKLHQWESKILPGVQFRAAFITGEEETRALTHRNNLHGLSDLEMRRVQFNNGEAWVNIDPGKLKDKIITEIRMEMRRVEGEQDDLVTVPCSNCGNMAEFNLLQLPDFMLPSVLS